LKISAILDYAGDVISSVEDARALENAGLDCIWVPEAYGFDAISLMGYLAAKTTRLEIGSSIVNVFTRTATLLAMSFAALDKLSDGRAMCGLGASGPQVIEGFHGLPYEKPMARTRETIEICRIVWRRETLNYSGRAIQIPLPDGQGTGLGKPLKLLASPLRPTIPIWWASIMPQAVEATAEVADGWIPANFIPERAEAVWGEALAAGKQKRQPDLGPLQIIAGGPARVTDDAAVLDATLDGLRRGAATNIGGMGARNKNFYNNLMSAYGWEAEATKIQDLFLAGDRQEAAAAVPTDYLRATSLVGSEGWLTERIAAYQKAGVTHLQLGLLGSIDEQVETVKQFRKLVDSV
jgi:F420-dependent oxidoreductase-like protein